jgi:hypothetical protein
MFKEFRLVQTMLLISLGVCTYGCYSTPIPTRTANATDATAVGTNKSSADTEYTLQGTIVSMKLLDYGPDSLTRIVWRLSNGQLYTQFLGGPGPFIIIRDDRDYGTPLKVTYSNAESCDQYNNCRAYDKLISIEKLK